MLLAMRDMNLAKLTSNDLPLFNGITRDLFPGVDPPTVDYSELQAAIEEEMKKANLQVFSFVSISFFKSHKFVFFAVRPENDHESDSAIRNENVPAFGDVGRSHRHREKLHMENPESFHVSVEIPREGKLSKRGGVSHQSQSSVSRRALRRV